MSYEIFSGLLVAEALTAIIAAPIGGVVLERRRENPADSRQRGIRRAARMAISVAAAVGVFAAVSGAFVTSRHNGEMWAYVAYSQVTMACATLALGMVGAFASLMFDDVLDAAASGIAIAVFFGCGIFVAGPVVAEMPVVALNAALLMNPIVAVASSANIDLFRGAFLYEYSPVAHRLFVYPSWYSASMLYALIAAMLLFARRTSRKSAASADARRSATGTPVPSRSRKLS